MTSNDYIILTDTNYTVDISCNDGDVRLVGGANDLEGRVEICYNKMWGSVCHNSWQNNDVHVVCKQLGHYSKGNIAIELTVIPLE